MLHQGNISKPQKYPLINREEPNLYRDIFPYDDPPRLEYDNVLVPLNIPETIWITDTTIYINLGERPGLSGNVSFSFIMIRTERR